MNFLFLTDLLLGIRFRQESDKYEKTLSASPFRILRDGDVLVLGARAISNRSRRR